MEVKPGYKKAEVGVIPQDWEVTHLGAHGQTYGGLTGKTKKDFGEGNAHYVTFMDVMSNVVIDRERFDRVHVGPSESQNRVQRSDLLFNGSSETPEEVAFCSLVPDDISDLYLNSFCFGYRLHANNSVDPLFLAYLFRSQTGRELVKALAQGSTRYNISKGALLSAPLAIPPIAEQQAIAATLSDMDALLVGLDRLIAKKRDIKQAAMRQLLTGQTRLPGFQGDWKMRLLPDLADIRSGGTPSTNDLSAWDGDIPWCTPTDITALAGRKYLSNTTRRITEHGLKQSSAEVIPAGSILMTSRATIGECAINTVPMTTNQGFKNFVPFDSVETEFLYYLLTTQKTGFVSLCGGSTFLEIGKTQLRSYGVCVPADKTEQTAIAKVLSDMDTELTALAARRDKTRALKQGMMQELLTGRTRLV